MKLQLAAFILAAASSTNASNILSWSGAGATGNWSDSGNWGFAGVPANGDTLVFPAAQPRLANTTDLASLSLSQIRFAGASGGYAIYGNAITITGGIEATNTAGANAINNGITLSSTDIPVDVGSGVSLTLAGMLQGTVGLTKNGAGTL